MDFHQLSIKEISKNTSDTVLISFDVPETLQERYAYSSGQYLTLETEINGTAVRRSYSLSSAAKSGIWEVAVKKVENGTMSTFLNNEITAGDRMSVGTPDGTFLINPEPERRASYYFIAAGSGITPIMSMIDSLLEEEPLSTIFLLYGNRDEASVIFKEKLLEMQKRYRGQLIIEFILSQGNYNKLPTRYGIKSRINVDILTRWFDDHPSPNRISNFYICGPGDMILSCRDQLRAFGIEEDFIHQEYFTPPEQPEDKGVGTVAVQEGTIKVLLDGQEIIIQWDKESSILQNVLDQGYDAPYSCMSGVCTSCQAKVSEGKVEMDMALGLSQKDIDNGYCLTCQAKPKTSSVSLSYDD